MSEQACSHIVPQSIQSIAKPFGAHSISSPNVISQADYKPPVPVELKSSIARLSCIYRKTQIKSLLISLSE